MARLADFLVPYVPLSIPLHLTSYIHGTTPVSTNVAVASALTSYLVVVFSLKVVMKNQNPYKLTSLFQIHNVILCSGSLLLLVLMLEEIVPFIWNRGFYAAICSKEAWTPRMEFYYMVNYYFKYLELLDTVFLVLKKKPMQFLHVFHHSATALLCYSQLEGRTSISWTVIVLNLAVHVIMYYYYYATAGGARFWWKKYLTTMQIVQFVLDIGLTYFGTYSHVAHARFPNFPHVGDCEGDLGAAFFGCALLTSYLGLFINFYFQTYKPSVRKQNGTANGKANGHVVVSKS